MRIYVDLCCLNRPFDDQTQPRIYLETQALVLLLDRIADGKHTLCGSAALVVENDQNPDAERRVKVEELLDLATDWIPHRSELDKRVQDLMKLGLRGLDAYHVASAETGACDRLVTCDDRFLKVCRRSAVKLK